MSKIPIVLKKVFVHNLKGIDLTIPSGKLVVFTGVSGSGKSSLAFDTIYAEGERRYIESLPHNARRFLGELPKPNAESISGISPTIAIEQKYSGKTPRSTVGTMTGISDYLRVLFAKVATPHCPISHEVVHAQSKEKIFLAIQQIPENSKMVILAPYAKDKKGEFQSDFVDLMKRGFMRLRIDQHIVEIQDIAPLDSKKPHNIDIVIDRIVRSKESESRLLEAASLALEIGQGFFTIYFPDLDEETLYSQFAYSPKSNLSYGPLEAHDFSFNHPSGMCPKCHGLGVVQEFDLNKIIDPSRSISADCCLIASSYETVRYGNIYRALARLYHFHIDTPWKDLPKAAQDVFLYGTKEKWTRITFVHPEKKTRWVEFVKWRGVLHEASERFRAAKSDRYRKNALALMTESTCPSCHGDRIKPYPAAAKLSDFSFGEISRMTIADAYHFFENLSLPPLEMQIAEELLKEIRQRFRYLMHIGVSYLSLDRTAPTLSGGESQRIRLASQIGLGLSGAIYILDEPSIGLHPRDHHKLIQTLLRLRDIGNSVIVVEHDRDTMLAADFIVDVGPLAGSQGGEILACGSAEDLIHSKRSITGPYLSYEKTIAIPKKRRRVGKETLLIKKASHHNLQNIDVAIPLHGFIAITGVSGSGKSSLISDILAPALSNSLHRSHLPVGKHETIEGIDAIDKVIVVDQSPIGRTPRSNAATYTKIFDYIRQLFSELPESQLRAFSQSHFSFNVKEGSCPYCQGMGSVKMDMDFMEDASIVCPQCQGKRFDPEILQVRFHEKNISDILEMSVDEATELFQNIPHLHHQLILLQKVGLGYLHLGQNSTTLSGGEAQRVKLAKELMRPSTNRTLYIFDEPTTGLHFQDLERLIQVFQELIERKSTVIVIEHNMELVKIADWVIDIGPGAGIDGGKIIGEGSPEKIATLSTPTGIALREALHPSMTLSTSIYSESEPTRSIVIRNATQNNLKNVSLTLPLGKMIAFTGPSGSGKSSLAFDTIYAEGQRRYTETLSGYARQAVMQMPKPKVDEILGLSPAIALEQKTGGLNPRSTIGTMTEITDRLRILYAHLGTAFCPETGEVICQISKQTVVDRILSLPEKEKVEILSPILPYKKESFAEQMDRLNRDGFLRVRLNKVTYRVDEEIPFDPQKKNELFLVIDRIVVEKKNKNRILESVEKASQRSKGIVVVAREKEDLYFNLDFAVEKTGKSYPPITSQTFSFNSEAGMCLECQGLGVTYGAHLEWERYLMRRNLFSIVEELLDPKVADDALPLLEKIFQKQKIDTSTPLKELTSEERSVIFCGTKEGVKMKNGLILEWIGLNRLLEQFAHHGHSLIRQELLSSLEAKTCLSCQGSRLNPLARHVKLNAVTFPELLSEPLHKTAHFIDNLKIHSEKEKILSETIEHIKKSISFLLELGLGYLSLDRSAPTLSGGELQRIRLARQLGSGLTSCLYVLDEPTIGLHPENCHMLLKALQKLCELGNTLILVEHDPLIIRHVDEIVDFGPASGKAGGQIVAQGSVDAIMKNPRSLTGEYLSYKKRIPIPKKRRPFNQSIRIENASLHNLKNISLSIPKAAITCFTGVSGSGKSTLLRYLLKPAAEMAAGRSQKEEPIQYLDARFFGLHFYEKVITIDQSPFGLSARADVSTYTEIQPLIRSFFAELPLSRARGYQPRHFSPNHFRGMCHTCWGLGYRTVDLQFLPAVQIPCESCHGYRLNSLSLEVRYKEKHMGEILEMSILDASRFFNAIPRIVRKLQTLIDVGLNYLQLGQPIATLSGGEIQRLRLSRELSKREVGKTLYLIDEPTVGLHSSDIAELLKVFHRLAEKKNTLVLIEHNLDMIANADYLIDFGPEAGEKGGQIVATGTPEEIAKNPHSITGRYLSPILNNESPSPDEPH